MALKLKIDTLSVDKMGRVITVKDSTGDYDATDNPGGYGSPNIQKQNVAGILYSISGYRDKEVSTAQYSRTAPPEDPECFANLDIDEILGGAPVQLNTIMFGTTAPEQGLGRFHDGVWDVNYYVYLGAVAATGAAGSYYVSGAGLTALQSMDSLIVNGVVYQIDHEKPTGDGTILFLTEPLKSTATEVFPAYRANTKVYVDRLSKCVMSRMSGKLADKLCGGGCDDGLLNRLLIIKHNRDASRLDFCERDYKGSDKKLKYAASLSGTINCGCN